MNLKILQSVNINILLRLMNSSYLKSFLLIKKYLYTLLSFLSLKEMYYYFLYNLKLNKVKCRKTFLNHLKRKISQ